MVTDQKLYFVIEDIRHTGHHGPKGESKEGHKYDYRRGHRIYLYGPLSQYEQYKDCSIALMDGEFEGERWFVLTTPFVELRDNNDIVEFETLNSVYILRRINEDNDTCDGK
ncbi:MAG: hypothetical protein ACI4F4_05920 [Lachnospiraceae bacterium]